MAKRGEHILDYASLLTRIENRRFEPIYLFFGEEDFLAEEAVKMIIEVALDETSSGFDLDVVYGPDSNGGEVITVARSFPMMAKRRIVVVRDFDHLPSKEMIEVYSKHPSDTTSLILVAPKPDLRTKPYPALKHTAHWIPCLPQRDYEIPGWIASRIKQKGREVSPEACLLLQNYVGNSLRDIDNEIEKLLIFVGEKERIDQDDVSEVVGMSKHYNIFELQKTIGRRDAKSSFEILERMLGAGESPIMMIAVLTRFFINLYKIHMLRRRRLGDREIADALRANPNYIGEQVANAERHPLEHIEHCFKHLLEADEKLKSTSFDQKLIMSLLTYRLVKD